MFLINVVSHEIDFFPNTNFRLSSICMERKLLG